MKKFDELKALAEKQAGRFDLFIGGSPENLLALLADREQLREALNVVTCSGSAICRDCHENIIEAREALKKSDEVENV